MRKHVLLSPFLHSLSPNVVAATMVALSFGSDAFCGDIYDAAQRGDLGKGQGVARCRSQSCLQ